MSTVTSWAAFCTPVVELHDYLSAVLLKGLGHVTQAGDESVVINAYLVGHHFAYLVDAADTQDYGTNTSFGPFFIEILFSLSDVAVLGRIVEPHPGKNNPILEFKLPDSDRFE